MKHLRMLFGAQILAMILACAGPLDTARDRAAAGEVAGAIADVEAVLAETPESAAALETLGDLHLLAAQQGDAETHAEAAAEAYGAAAELQRYTGIYGAKQALALHLAGARDEAGIAALKALDCCAERAALPFITEPNALRRSVAAQGWEAAPEWTQLAAFAGTHDRQRLIVKAESAVAKRADGTPGPELGRGDEALVLEAGASVVFEDLEHPSYEPATGYVDGHRYCDQPYEGFTCRGRQVRDAAAEIHVGPCWHAEEPPEEDLPLIPPDRIKPNSVQCVRGPPRAQEELCPEASGSCPVTLEQISYARVSLGADEVWLAPAEAPSPASAIAWAAEDDVRDHLARGELALGLPEPLVRFAARDAPDAAPASFEVEAGALTVVYTSAHGSFTFVDGVLGAWSPG